MAARIVSKLVLGTGSSDYNDCNRLRFIREERVEEFNRSPGASSWREGPPVHQMLGTEFGILRVHPDISDEATGIVRSISTDGVLWTVGVRRTLHSRER